MAVSLLTGKSAEYIFGVDCTYALKRQFELQTPAPVPMPSTGQAGPDVFASGFRFARHVPVITPAENRSGGGAMNIERCEDLIDWTRKAHTLLADCMAEGAKERSDSLAKMLLDYLAQHERELAATVARVKEHAEASALQAPLHDAVQGDMLRLDIDSETFAQMTVDEISQHVFALHNRIIDLYRSLQKRRELHKASGLLGEMPQLEERETMLLAHQVNRMHEM